MTDEQEALNPGHLGSPSGDAPDNAVPPVPHLDTMHKKKTLVLSLPERLEGLAAVVLVIAGLIFLVMSGHTLYYFPAPDSYRWYGDETQTWMLLGWKHLIAHGRMIVPIALESMLLKAPGLLLGSAWCSAILYGIPQLLFPPHFDPVSIGRTVSFLLGLSCIFLIAFAAYRLKLSASLTSFGIVLLLTTRAFTFATHSARYDIITGFAILTFIAFFALRVGTAFGDRPRRGARFAFWFGFVSILLALTVSPHVAALLILPTIFIAWYFGCFEKWSNVFLLVFGAALGFALLAAAYMAANHELVIFGMAAGDNQAHAYLEHLPILHVFSWSAQSHQLGAKLYYLWHEAPPFVIVLPLILLSEILLLIKKQRHAVTLFLTICLFLTLIDAALLQSTLPYYLIHFLPLAALTFVAHIQEWTKLSFIKPIVAIASFVVALEICVIWLPELSNAGHMGKRLGDANTAAVQAAIEFASRNWIEGSKKPLILAQGPAVHELLRDPSLNVMSEAFLFFPVRQEPVDSILRDAGVQYIIDYDKPMTPAYEQAVHTWKPIFMRSGPLLDRTLNYFHDTTSELDTLTLYERDSTP